MHFSIQNTGEINDKGVLYTIYNLYINGSSHCSFRYSQLHDFNGKLKKEFHHEQLPDFPPKKLFNLSAQQIEERRVDLEKYFQSLSQIPRIANSNYFKSFLLQSQKESQVDVGEDVLLDILMPNRHKITISIKSYDHSNAVLQAVAKKISLKESFVYYFGLFLFSLEESEKLTIVRKLQDYEAPFISLRIANTSSPHSLFIRKRYWDSTFDDILMDDRISMNILYVQSVTDIDSGLIEVTKSQQKDLCSFQNDGSKRDFLKFARTLKFYNCFVFENCIVDYPKENTRISLSVGMYELRFLPLIKMENTCLDFKITRMRCWRIFTNDIPTKNNFMEISFEYLMTKDTLQWVSILSTQAILISSCIQSMVDELIMKRDNLAYELQVNQNLNNGDNNSTHINGNSKQKVSKIWNSNVTVSQSMSFNPLSDNQAFDGIKEDDL